MSDDTYMVPDATKDMFARYLTVIEAQAHDPYPNIDPKLSLVNLAWICKEGSQSVHTLPIDKTSRWLGFVQGCLAMRGLSSVDTERDVSRPLFHEAYKNEGIEIPSRRERD